MRYGPVLPIAAMLVATSLMVGCTTNATSSADTPDAAAATTSDDPPRSAAMNDSAKSQGAPLGRYVIEGKREADTWVEIADGRIGAKAGCNALGANYTIADDGRWTVSPVMRSKMFCEGRMEAEDALIAKLSATQRVVRDGDRVQLVDADGATLLTLVPE